MSTNDDQTVRQLRLAVQNLACAPQAQRRYVQMGLMPRAIGNLDQAGAALPQMVADGALTAEQAELVGQLREVVLRQMAAGDDFLEEAEAGPREYLFGHALENPRWDEVRHLARRCHSLLVGEQSPFLALMAR